MFPEQSEELPGPDGSDDESDRESLRRSFARLAWRDRPTVHLQYYRTEDVLVARFLPLDGARRQYVHDRLCVDFDGGDDDALPTALAMSDFLRGLRSAAGVVLRELLGDLVWGRAVELSVSGDDVREVDLDRYERDVRLASWHEFAGRPRYALGVEVVPGGIRAVLVDDRGTVQGTWTRPLDGVTPPAVARAVGAVADAVRAAHGHQFVVSVEIGGPVDRRTGTVHAYNKGSETDASTWENIPLAQLVEKRCGASTLVLNDVEALATYERWFELGRSFSRYGVLLVDEGIGGAFVNDGEIDPSMPMELGNIVIHPDGRPCRCGNKGCVEAGAGMWAVVERIAQETDYEVDSLADAVMLLERGDDRHSRIIALVLQQAGADLAAAIGTAQAIVNLPAWAVYVPAVLYDSPAARENLVSGIEQFGEWVSYKPYRECSFVLRPTTGEDGARGAALAALEHHGISSPCAAYRTR